MKLEYNGNQYESIPEPDGVDCCQGCAFVDNHHCPNTDNSDTRCYTGSFVWKEVKLTNTQNIVLGEPKYTVAEVLVANSMVYCDDVPKMSQINEVSEYLKLHSDPEYQKYLELKAKFGGNS